MSYGTSLQILCTQLLALAAEELTEEGLVQMQDRVVRIESALVLAGEVLRQERSTDDDDVDTAPPTMQEMVDAVHQQHRLWRAMAEGSLLGVVEQERHN